jgi:hypothetical protein
MCSLDDILQISSVEQLAGVLATLNGSQLQKQRRHHPDAPIYRLLDAYPGDTLREKAYVAIHGAGTCATCGGRVPFHGIHRGFALHCSRACLGADQEHQARNVVARQATMLQRHGATTTLASPTLASKVRATNLARYGNEQAAASSTVVAKRTNTNLQRYGGSAPACDPTVAAKTGAVARARAVQRHAAAAGRLGFTLLETWEAPTQRVRWRCAHGHEFMHTLSTEQRLPLCRRCHPMVKGTSRYEGEIADWLRTKGLEVETRRRFAHVDGYAEADLFVPAKSIAIEFNGLYWHSEQAGKGPRWHLEKLQRLQRHGLQVINIFEHEWRLKRPIVESVLAAKLGLLGENHAARKLELRPLSHQQAEEWFNRTHLAGAARTTYAEGLFLGDRPLLVAGWAPTRFGGKKGIELIRMSSELNVSVVGGLGRLTAAARRRWPTQTLRTFCDRRWSTGTGYLAAGWTLVGDSPPCQWFFSSKSLHVEHRSRWQKKRLQQMLPCESGTAHELATKLGLNWFWDCGNFTFEITP